MPKLLEIFFMENSESSLSKFLQRKDCVYTQLVKYVFCGGISVVVDQAVFYLLAWLVFPILPTNDPFAQFIGWFGLSAKAMDLERFVLNYWIIKTVCFIASNAVVYLLNVLFVFQGGRHKRYVEIAMFFGFSLLQFFYIWLGGVLMKSYGWLPTYANLTMLVLGIITNYVARKNIVFKG